MSSRSKHSRRSSTRYPSQWSEWEWNETYRRHTRYRETSQGTYEWEYGDENLEVSSAIYKSRDAIPRADPSYEQIHSSPIHDQSYSDPSYSQSHSSEQYEHDANISSLTEDLAGVSIGSSYEDTQGVKEKRKGNEAADAHYETTTDYVSEGVIDSTQPSQNYESGYSVPSSVYPGPSAYSVPQTYPASQGYNQYAGFQSQAISSSSPGYPGSSAYSIPQTYPASQGYNQYMGFQSQAISSTSSGYPMSQQQTNIIKTSDPATTVEKLDSRYKVHRQKDFKFGKIFEILWFGPPDEESSEAQQFGPQGSNISAKIRRFVILSVENGYVQCLPILTYKDQGAKIEGVDPYSHAAIYSSERGPKYLKHEDRSLQQKPIKLELSNPKYELDPASRLNYAKTYTVEGIVKLRFIGRVSPKYEQTLYTTWKEHTQKFTPYVPPWGPVQPPIPPRPSTPQPSGPFTPNPNPLPHPDHQFPPPQGHDGYTSEHPRYDDLYD